MRSMDDGPWTGLGTLGWFLGAWVVMMAAIMFPSVAPTVALHSRITRGSVLRFRHSSSQPAAGSRTAACFAVARPRPSGRSLSIPMTQTLLPRLGDDHLHHEVPLERPAHQQLHV